MAEAGGEVGNWDEFVFSVAEPDDAAGDDGDADVLEHEGIEAELEGIDGTVFFREVGKGSGEHASVLAVVFVLEAGVGLVVEYDEACGLAVRAVGVVEHVEGACKLLLDVQFRAGVLAAVGTGLVEDEVHGGRHVVHESEDGFFLGMDGCEEVVLGHVLGAYGWADALGHSGTEIAEALAVGVCLGAEGLGTEGVLAPLLYPVLRRLSVSLGIADGLTLVVEGFTDEAMHDV